ncbi:hypothetical protein ABCR94_20385 [Streptomyces sp. 21So2-11]|uniref:hypothetical protein n=1 Tax=Streptomyces sp. 21So2-11 TaxID=3144408 RepID=UPI003219504B
MSINLIEVDFTTEDDIEAALADWSFTGGPEAMKAIERAARHMAFKYESSQTIEHDDAYQEGLILTATHPRLRECFSDPNIGLGVLHHRLIQLLTTRVRTEAKHRSGTRSWEANQAGLEAMGC